MFITNDIKWFDGASYTCDYCHTRTASCCEIVNTGLHPKILDMITKVLTTETIARVQKCPRCTCDVEWKHHMELAVECERCYKQFTPLFKCPEPRDIVKKLRHAFVSEPISRNELPTHQQMWLQDLLDMRYSRLNIIKYREERGVDCMMYTLRNVFPTDLIEHYLVDYL